MKVVVDTNILLSALIRDSSTRKIIIESGWDFYYPEISFYEVRKYKSLVMKKSGMSDDDYSSLVAKMLTRIILLPEEQIVINMEEAKRIMLHIDPDDVAFIAAALSVENSVIWSNDNHFEMQGEVGVIKTKAIIDFFE